MKKKIQIIQQTVYELEPFDATTIKFCLNYCYHRMKKHGKYTEYFDEVQRLRKEFDIIKKC